MSFFVVTRVNFAGLGGVVIALKTVPAREMGVISGGSRFACCKMPLSLPVMIRGLLVMVRGIVMMAHCRMFAGHA
jgi:hypothetical protein